VCQTIDGQTDYRILKHTVTSSDLTSRSVKQPTEAMQPRFFIRAHTSIDSIPYVGYAIYDLQSCAYFAYNAYYSFITTYIVKG